MKSKVLFIINPISGGRKKDKVPALIKKYLDAGKYEYQIAISNGIMHARQLALQNLREYDIIVAVGGDGTINEVASALVGTDTSLGIIPYGSGNGLSRFLNIPMNTEDAFKTLSEGNTEMIDAAKFNDKWFFNMAGLGFDAHISEVFAREKTRGFITYIKSSITEISKYKAKHYHLDIDGVEYDVEAFMLSFANSSQFGNNAHISPHASVQDGLIDVCIVKQFPLYRFPEMGWRMLNKTSDKTPYVRIIQGKHIKVTRTEPGPVHLDGEPDIVGENIEIKVVPGILKIIVGSSYQK